MKIILQKIKTTEKIVRNIEAENTLVFETDRYARKQDIKNEVEGLFDVKVDRVRTMIKNNKKTAFVKLNEKHPAIDIATKLGVM